MDINVFLPHELDTVLRVLRTALNPDGTLSATERSFLDTYALICGRAPLRADPLPVDPQDVVVEGSHRRKRLVQLSALAVLLGRPLRPQSITFLKTLSTALATHDPVIDVIEALAKGRRRTVRLLAMRRAMRAMFKEAWLAEGTRGALRFAGAMFLKLSVNRDQHWRFRRLGLLPDGTLGREYWKHMTTVGFGFPGDRGGIPAPVAYHDVAHVLAEHDVSAAGEIQQGSFQGGNRREDGFFFVQFVVLHFHQGVKITPGAPPEVGQFDPRKVLWAMHRGAQCNVDLTHQWDFWPLMALPIEEARSRCGLLPHLPVAT